nr:hypothetical protein [uncultured Acetatifactor sp.]
METLVFLAAMAAFVLIIFASESARVRKEEKKFIQSLYEDYFGLSRKEYALERFARMGSYFGRHQKEGQLDDITWNDLGMDELFKRMNYTLSASGEEYLYYTLRTLKQSGEELEHLEEAVGFFGGHPDVRVQVQLAMKKLGHTGKYSLYDYLDNLDVLGERSPRKHLLMDLLFVPLVGLMWVNISLAIVGLLALVIYNILTYFREKGEIDPYITSFSYIMRLMQACGELEKISVPACAREWEEMRQARKQLQGMRRNSYWVMSPYRGNASGDILAILMDYIRMIFHVDLIKFDSMLKVLRGHIEDVDAMIGVVGYVETAIAIWIFRESLVAEQKGQENAEAEMIQSNGMDMAEGMRQNEGADAAERPEGHGTDGMKGTLQNGGAETAETEPWNAGTTDGKKGRGWCVPEFHAGEGMQVEEGYHPLLSKPVKNGIAAKRGVLLTGSNASGKSTFLKTVALNGILAQTIHTCTADRYRAPFYQVYSSMTLRDDLDSGESYYIVEIKALKRILDAASAGKGQILCFVDEVLRGTNTVERIAASTQILKSLGSSGILCFAATHDIELTELLQDDFDNYHFEEDVREGDVFFNYKLKGGKATTRNAIKLLELMGYDKDVIKKATDQAEHFTQFGVWQK